MKLTQRLRAQAAEKPPNGTPPIARAWQRLSARYPEVATAYAALREACQQAGPLDARTAALVRLAVSVGAGATRTLHAHTRKALAHNIPPDELRHVALVALPTIGLPATLEALKRIEQSIEEACETLGVGR